MSMPLPPKGKHLFGIVTVGDKGQIVIPAKGIRALRYENDDSFKGSIGNIYQSFAGQEIYPSLQEKAANLLYFVTKNHSFWDGNKRIAATMFLYFLDRNSILYDEAGDKRLDDHTLVALTIMIAESKPEEKEMMISVIMNCID